MPDEIIKKAGEWRHAETYGKNAGHVVSLCHEGSLNDAQAGNTRLVWLVWSVAMMPAKSITGL
ncbi:hypothetical protein [Mobiluncus mulieris]|uniref:hypothetical protein n=1 Tax=Mobiluncus mulieris TaxID=2052 RepID=UPI000E063404|nr:hypothetical protein [Mobiluncus mulieris]STY98458.1 Uncharacterised protein [Mobiluncus mulieris]